MASGMGSQKNLAVIIGTSNFDILESRTVWPIEVEKKRPLLYLTFVAWTSNFFCYFCNASDVSSLKNEVGTSKVSISINWRRRRKSNGLADQDKNKESAFLFYPIRRDFKLYFKIFRQIQSEN